MCFESNQEVVLPVKFEQLLADFMDVIPEEVQHGFPPMRDIQHAIDFVPGAVIPNRPAYKMSPQEHAEVQRQVGQLLRATIFSKIDHHS
ncbi:putative gag-pol polyprotein [Trifolium medium]|uniref:Putative gag-pol polyprotein n=1 Tax=Trifolium medium TaxID=97028 RepID=A0A392SKM1_9FABA|nr:putative gag-pol polyprotein [Trifolium medium]